MAYKRQKFISHISGGWKSKIKVPTDSVSGERPLPDSETVLGLCPPVMEGARQLALCSLFHNSSNPIHEGSTLMIFVPPKDPVS